MRIEFKRKHVHDENILTKMQEAKFLAEEQNESVSAFYLTKDEYKSLIIEGQKMKLWSAKIDPDDTLLKYKIAIWDIPVYEE